MASSERQTSSVTEGTGLSAGVARVVITPPVGIGLVGFAGRPPSTGVHDDLTATALVFSEGDNAASRVAVVALDLLGMYGEEIGPAIKAQVQAVTGIPGERVFLNCSHTHYGPVVSSGRDGSDEQVAVAYREALPHHVAGVVAAANSARRPVTLSAGRGSVRVGINRRERKPDGKLVLGQNPEGTLDSEVIVWRFDAAGGEEVTPGAPLGWVRRSTPPVAVVINYPCHAVSLSGQMRMITADFPGVAREVVERLVGGTALYVQGACGNINPSLMGPTWEHPRLLGNALGAAAARVALTSVEPLAATPLRVARETLDLPGLLPASVESAREQVAALEAERARLASQEGNAGARWWNQNKLEQMKRGLEALEGGAPLPPVRGDVSVLRLGDAALAGNPSELFCEIGMTIKQRSPYASTIIAGYTDGAVGYIPTRAAYPEGGYEVERACRVNPAAGEMVEQTTLRLLRETRS